jgi:acyl-coenzyme A synthetase/AMP-(fatty) acid ligase
MGTQALRSRIVDCQAKAIVCSDYTFRRGKKIPLKPTIDEAVRDLVFVEHVVVHRRGSRVGDAPYEFESERDIYWSTPTSAGSSDTRSSSTGRSPSARRSSAARACPTGRRPKSPGSSASDSA